MTKETNFVLKYQCECLRHVPESAEQCPNCSRLNPYRPVSPSFMALPVSERSVIMNRERLLREVLKKLGK